jgi:hypothetical protein
MLLAIAMGDDGHCQDRVVCSLAALCRGRRSWRRCCPCCMPPAACWELTCSPNNLPSAGSAFPRLAPHSTLPPYESPATAVLRLSALPPVVPIVSIVPIAPVVPVVPVVPIVPIVPVVPIALFLFLLLADHIVNRLAPTSQHQTVVVNLLAPIILPSLPTSTHPRLRPRQSPQHPSIPQVVSSVANGVWIKVRPLIPSSNRNPIVAYTPLAIR